MKDFKNRGKSEKVSEKQGRISRGGGENIFWLARIYSPEVKFKQGSNSEWKEAVVLSRAGKATGKFSNWYNVSIPETLENTCITRNRLIATITISIKGSTTIPRPIVVRTIIILR